jgi:hypothetical protein
MAWRDARCPRSPWHLFFLFFRLRFSHGASPPRPARQMLRSRASPPLPIRGNLLENVTKKPYRENRDGTAVPLASRPGQHVDKFIPQTPLVTATRNVRDLQVTNDRKATFVGL